MSHLFQRPLCEMGKAFDFAYRPIVGEPGPEFGGPCDDRPRSVELCDAHAEPRAPTTPWRTFLLCPDHEAQLRVFDARFPGGSRFRSVAGTRTAPTADRRAR